jgi:hypothetical protein
MRPRKSEWTDDELKQLAAILAAGGTAFRAAVCQAKEFRGEVCGR